MSPDQPSSERLPAFGNAAQDDFDVRDMSLAELVVRSDASVRLQRAVLSPSDDVEIRTVRDYLEAGELAPRILMRDLRNFGSKTADELDGLVHGVATGWNPESGTFEDETFPLRRTVPPRPQGADGVDVTQLDAAFGSSTLRDVLKADFISVRLGRAIDSDLGDKTFVFVMSDWPSFEAEFLQLRSVGRRSLRELRELCVDHMSKRIPKADDASQSADDPVIETIDEHPLAPVPTASLHDILLTAITHLDDREADIVRRRHGIDGERAETLEEIGASYRITRERVRQIESLGLKKVRIKAGVDSVGAALGIMQSEIWQRFAAPFVLFDEVPLQRRALDPYVALAFSVVKTTLEQWFDATALRLPYGWFRDRGREEAISSAAADLREFSKRWPQPRVIPAREEDYELRRAALRLILGWHLEAGYLAMRRPGPRLSRAIHLHAQLAGSSSPTVLSDLVSAYRRARPSDPCSQRDATIVMDAAPHLFLETFEDRWLALGKGGTALAALPVLEEAAASDADAQQDPTLVALMTDVLRRTGPSRFVDLREAAAAVLPPGRSLHSIGPTLVTRRETFVRPLPGVYALHDQVPTETALLKGDVPYLLSETQVRLLALARHAGEPWGTFALWTPASEYRLCRWARSAGSSEGFASLLAVASISEWPLDAEEKESWFHLAAKHGRFTLTNPLKPDAFALPELDRVLAACIEIRDTGVFNWMATNRIERNRIEAASGIATLAVLVAAGALESREGEAAWHRSHAAGPDVSVLADTLASELHDTGTLVWDGAAGRQLQNKLRSRLQSPIGWLPEHLMVAMLDTSTRELTDDAVAADAADVVIADRKRRLDAERREETLRWLLAG